MKHRLREHNREIKGGARSTGRGNGDWEVFYYVSGLPNRRVARQLEWRLHRRHRGRMAQLAEALARERFTAKAPLTATLPLRVHWADEEILTEARTLIPTVMHVKI